MQNNHRHLLYALAMAAGILVVCGGLVVWPKYRAGFEAVEQRRDLEQKMKDIGVRAEMLDQLLSRVERVRYEMDTTLRPIPPSADVHQLMTELSQAVAESEVKDLLFSAGQPGSAGEQRDGTDDATSSLRSIPLNVELQGSFEHVHRLLHAVDQLPRLVRVAHVRIWTERSERRTGSGAAAAGSHDESPMVRASINLEVVFDSGERPAQPTSQRAGGR